MRAAKVIIALLGLGLGGYLWYRWSNRWRTLTHRHSDWAGKRHLFDTPWGWMWFSPMDVQGVVKVNEWYELGHRIQGDGTFEVYMSHLDPKDPMQLSVYKFDYENRTVMPFIRKADALS